MDILANVFLPYSVTGINEARIPRKVEMRSLSNLLVAILSNSLSVLPVVLIPLIDQNEAILSNECNTIDSIDAFK